jgi:hypothetical protein
VFTRLRVCLTLQQASSYELEQIGKLLNESQGRGVPTDACGSDATAGEKK